MQGNLDRDKTDTDRETSMERPRGRKDTEKTKICDVNKGGKRNKNKNKGWRELDTVQTHRQPETWSVVTERIRGPSDEPR